MNEMTLQKNIKKTIYRLLDTLPGSGWLLKKIRRFEARISALENNIVSTTVADEWRRVDMLDFGPVSIYMYVDDLAYQNTRLSIRNYSMSEHLKKMASVGPDGWSALEKPDKLNLLPWVCRHYRLQGLPFVYIDVGCQYGASALYVAHILRARGWDNRIIAFDIGKARSLVDFNIELNRQQARMVFEAMAVSNHNLPSIVFTEKGHSENNRIVNRDRSSEYESYVIRSTTIDDYLTDRHISDNIILKVDAQGGEFEIWQGMQNTWSNRLVTGLFEFTPHALQSRVAPAEFLAMLGQDAWLVDIPPDDGNIEPILPGEWASFTLAVNQRQSRQTDILAIPKKLPGGQQLFDSIGEAN